ncbi:Tetratricopeptide repeat protein [anaerobic digester metagenome]
MTFEQLMGCHEKNQGIFERLCTQMDSNNVIPFIGSGMSAWIYPTWSKLLTDIATEYGIVPEISKMLNDGEFEEAAERLEKEVVKHTLLKELEDAFAKEKLATVSMPEYVSTIPQIWNGTIMTTNFDRIIETAFQHENIVIDHIFPNSKKEIPRIDGAAQQNQQLLIKLHGDINDVHNVVLTKSQYDDVYGHDKNKIDFSKELPRNIKQLISARVMLFLGCGLASDRTMNVVSTCSNALDHFALVGLPKDTENEADPYAPILKEADGSFKPEYNKTRKHLSRHSINCIWYPCGMHAQALEALLMKLSQMYKKKALVTGLFEPLHRLVGRDVKVEQTVNCLLNSEGGKVIVVMGPPGIGKTELCKGVYARIIAQRPSTYVPFVDCTAATNITQFFVRVADGFGITFSESMPPDNYADYLISHISEINQRKPTIVYMDNWEDLWWGVKNDSHDRKKLSNWINRMKEIRVDMLISSREFPGDWEHKPVNLQPLPPPYDMKLFNQVCNFKYPDRDRIDELLVKLDGHPLAIVLVATQALYEPSISDVLKRWRDAESHSQNSRHDSLAIALKMSWNRIVNMPSACDIWGLLSIAKGDISGELLAEALERNELYTEQEWREGRSELIKSNLAFYRNGLLAMLIPIKRVCFQYANRNSAGGCERCIMLWSQALLNRVNNAYIDNPDHELSHKNMILVLPEVLNVLIVLITADRTEATEGLLFHFCLRMSYYYQFSLDSKDVLEQLCAYYHNKAGNQTLLANLLLSKGELLSLLGDIEGAKKAYEEAEPLYIDEQDNLGLANILQHKGDLLSRTGDIKGAEKAYGDAESLYIKEQNNLGLADLLRSKGELLGRIGDVEGAKKAYGEAEPLYIKEQSNLGLANLLLNKGDLLSRIGDIEGVKKAYGDAEPLYLKEQNNLGLANLLRSKGDLLILLGDIEGAKKAYGEAEPLYIKEQSNLGLANLLLSEGELLSRIGDIEGAKKVYGEAEPLYIKEQCNLGLANLLLSKGELLSRIGDIEGAKKAYGEAEPLYIKEQSNLGLANLLRSKGDLLSRIGDIKDAKKAYGEAEPLYIKEQDNLGLANLLRSKGQLLSWLGDIEGAKKAYGEAEPLYIKGHDNLGLANFLRCKGDLLSQIGDNEDAKKAYGDAEPLYIKEQDNLGLANLLRSKGELLSGLGDIEGAKKAYDKAELLYIKEQDNLGLANLLRSKGDLLKQSDSTEDAISAYLSATELYIQEQENVGLSYTLAQLCDSYGIINNRDLVINMIVILIFVLDDIKYEDVKEYARSIISNVVAKMKIEVEEIFSLVERLKDDQ